MMRPDFQPENPAPTPRNGVLAMLSALHLASSRVRTGGRGRKAGRGRTGSANAIFLAASFLVVTSAVALLGMRFPAEATRWKRNQEEIRQLQETIATLRKLEAERLERLKSIEQNLDDAGLEVRRKYHLYKPGEKVFVLPPSKPEVPDAANSLPEVSTPATP
jgi:cell division protein FtsB